MRNISRLDGKPSALLSKENVHALFCDGGFGSTGQVIAWRVLKGAPFCMAGPVRHHLCVEAKGPNNGRALRDAPCTLTPRLASLERPDGRRQTMEDCSFK